MKKRIYQAFFVIFLIAVYGSLWMYADLRELCTVASLQRHQELLCSLVHNHYFFSVIGFILLYSLHGSFALPATSLLIMASGFLFGIIPGILYSLIGSMIGGSIAFFATRSLFGKSLHRRYHTQLASFQEQFDRHSTTYLLVMRIIPIIPFFLANVLSGLALIPPRTFLWTLIVGILPSLLIYALLGTELRTMNAPQDLMSWKMISLYGIIVILTIIPLIRTKYTK